MQLLLWGFPLRDGVAEVVGQLARSELQRPSAEGGDLGPDQIENIFEIWFCEHYPAPEWRSQPSRPWNRINVNYRREGAPKGLSLADTARALIRNHGKWPNPEELPGHIPMDGSRETLGCGDPKLTKKAHEEYLRNRLHWIGSLFKTG